MIGSGAPYLSAWGGNNAETQYHRWSRPNRRFIDEGIYLPSLHSETISPMVFAVDTSGSMSDAELAAVWSEIRSCASELQPESVTVIQCDEKIQKVETWDPSDLPVELHIAGRYGTSFVPVFDWIQDNATETPACLIYMTDTMGDWPAVPADYPVLVVATQQAYVGAEWAPPYWVETIDLPEIPEEAA